MNSNDNIFSVRYKGKEVKFFVENKNDLIQSCHVKGFFFDIDDMESCLPYIPANATGNHSIFFSIQENIRKVIPFEINPTAYQILRASVKESQLKNIDLRYIGIGLSHAPGTVRLKHSTSDNLGATCFTEESTDGIGQLFETNSLDNLLSSDISVDFMKLDVEGMESAVLKGAEKLFTKNRPVIFTETFGWVATLRLLAWSAIHGYRMERKIGPNYLLLPLANGERFPETCQIDLAEGVIEGIVHSPEATAARSIEGLYEKYKENSYLAYGFGEIFLKWGNAEAAFNAFKQAEKNSSAGFPALYESLAQVTENIADLLIVLERATAIEPVALRMVVRLAELYWQEEKHDAARQLIASLLKKDPDSSLAHHEAGVFAERCGDVNDMLYHAERAAYPPSQEQANYLVRQADLVRVYDSPIKARAILNRAFALGNESAWARAVSAAIEQDLTDCTNSGNNR